MSNFIKLIREVGAQQIQLLSDHQDRVLSSDDVIGSGCLGIDVASSIGGWPRSRIVEIFGGESCLAHDTSIRFGCYDPVNDKFINSKGGTIRDLYNRFNRKGKFSFGDEKPRWDKTRDCIYTIPSVNDEGIIFHNEVTNVICNGLKKVYLIKTVKGNSIKCTSNHRFMMLNGSFKRMKELLIGDALVMHTNKRNIGRNPLPYRKDIMVKHHPFWPSRIIDGKYEYKRSSYSRCVYEAFMNGLSVTEYIFRLNTNNMSGLCFLDPTIHIHHIDENPSNNEVSNLCPISPQKHGMLHSKNKVKNLSFIADQDEIESIEEAGIDFVYDISVSDPHRNYVANNFVVHNSGKSTIATLACAQCNKEGKYAAYVDLEHAFDINYGLALGIKKNLFALSQPSNADEACQLILDAARQDDCGIVVVDSVAAMVTTSELEGELSDANIGAVARLMGKTLKQLTAVCRVNKTLVIFINQNRDVIGGFGFGPTQRQPGGRSLKFYASMRVECARISTNKGKKEKANEAISNTTQVTFKKNKVGMPYRVARFDIIFGKGVDNYKTAIELAVKANVIKKTGNTFSYKGAGIGVGIEKASEYARKTKGFYKEVRGQILSSNIDFQEEEEKEKEEGGVVIIGKKKEKETTISVTETGESSIQPVRRLLEG